MPVPELEKKLVRINLTTPVMKAAEKPRQQQTALQNGKQGFGTRATREQNASKQVNGRRPAAKPTNRSRRTPGTRSV